MLALQAGKHYEGFAEGEGTTAKFNDPKGLAYRKSGTREYLYVADAENRRIRYIELSYRNRVTTFISDTTYKKILRKQQQVSICFRLNSTQVDST